MDQPNLLHSFSRATRQNPEFGATAAAAEHVFQLQEKILKLSGIPNLAHRDFALLLEGLARGAAKLSHSDHGTEWAALFTEAQAKRQETVTLREKIPSTSSSVQIAKLIAQQPSPHFAPITISQTLFVAAKAFILILAHEHARPPKVFSSKLAQLFHSPKPEWEEARGIDLSNLVEIEALAKQTRSNSVADFLKACISVVSPQCPSPSGRLRSSTGAIAPDSARFDQLHPPRQPAIPSQEPIKESDEPELDNSPNDYNDLFALQRRDGGYTNFHNGYRLPLHWRTQSFDEHRISATKLAGQLLQFNQSSSLDTCANKEAICSAFLFTSLFAGLPTKAAWQIPFTNVNSLYIDLSSGCITRDGFQVASWSEEVENETVTNRWWRTPLPKQVTAVLTELWLKSPTSLALGQLLESAGVTREDCIRYLNTDWVGVHKPEDARFARSLSRSLRALGIHPAVVARVTGTTNQSPLSDHYYLSLKNADINDAVRRYCAHVGLEAGRLVAPEQRTGPAHFVEHANIKAVISPRWPVKFPHPWPLQIPPPR